MTPQLLLLDRQRASWKSIHFFVNQQAAMGLRSSYFPTRKDACYHVQAHKKQKHKTSDTIKPEE
jgi:hypothetical protein